MVNEAAADIRSIDAWPAPWAMWFWACTAAEFIGMAAAAGMAAVGIATIGEPSTFGEAAVIVTLAVVGGSIEGLAVGGLQARVLRTWLPGLSAVRYVGATVVLAATFWLLGMLPSTLASLGSSTAAATREEPSLLAVLAVSALGGALGGVAFGAVQGWSLRGHVAHPWRWIRPNAVGWALAVAVITVGASVVQADAPPALLMAYGAGVGLLAGACVGAVTAQAVPSLTVSLPWWNRVVVDLLLSPVHRLLSGSVMLVRFVGRRSGRTITLPVQYALHDAIATVYVADASGKQWWRSFMDGPRPVQVVIRGRTIVGLGAVVAPGASAHSDALAAYRARWPRVQVDDGALFVEVSLGPPLAQPPTSLTSPAVMRSSSS